MVKSLVDVGLVVPEVFAKRLKYVRMFIFQENQRQFAARLGVSQKALSSWETAKSYPNCYILKKIIIAAHQEGKTVTCDWMLGIPGSNPPLPDV